MIGSVLVAIPGYAEIYKWVDANGETNYSERKPDGELKFETVTPWTGRQAGRGGVEAPIDAVDERQKAGDEADAKSREAAADTAELARKCQQAQLRLTSLERPRVNQINPDGSRTRMTEEARQAGLEEARAAIKKLCK
jgi:hypothetical protein